MVEYGIHGKVYYSILSLGCYLHIIVLFHAIVYCVRYLGMWSYPSFRIHDGTYDYRDIKRRVGRL